MRGATISATGLLEHNGTFQSAPPCGGRRQVLTRTATGQVSIRAPVRGATGMVSWARIVMRMGFNPRPRAGGDAVGMRLPAIQFQSAPPCGGRQAAITKQVFGTKEFQSAPPCGGRLEIDFSKSAPADLVSIRAPVRGATRRGRSPDRPRSIWFQSAPPCGGRHGRHVGRAAPDRFQSAPPCGGRHVIERTHGS